LNRPTLHIEQGLWSAGFRRVVGVDEVGRGAWAGPVVAAAVLLPPNRPDVSDVLCDVRDSKQLTPAGRLAVLPGILAAAAAVGVGLTSSSYIDEHGIVPATYQAMLMALRNLKQVPDHLLIDGLWLPGATVPQRAIPHGDVTVLSIAAASVVAKVYRDRLMMECDFSRPGYGFSHHKGYGTPEHQAALARLGPCPLHRRSFRPLRGLDDLSVGVNDG